MIQEISRAELKTRMESNHPPVVVEVLSEDEFRDFHISGARNVPLGKNFDQDFQSLQPDKEKPVVVYCKDTSCDAAPKAARRLEEIGYKKVFDYRGGKEDWKEAGYPVESGTH